MTACVPAARGTVRYEWNALDGSDLTSQSAGHCLDTNKSALQTCWQVLDPTAVTAQ